MATTQPECFGCRRAAPDPRSSAAEGWEPLPRGDEPFGPIMLCPSCFASEDIREQARDEAKRAGLALARDPEMVVFVRGTAKVLSDCSEEEVQWLKDESDRMEQQWAAWVEWNDERHAEGEES